MAKEIRCPCLKNAKCLLCSGKGSYPYKPGPQGWLPFPCPTCTGKRFLLDENHQKVQCLTCHGEGRVDPANPPNRGLMDILWKTFFGA